MSFSHRGGGPPGGRWHQRLAKQLADKKLALPSDAELAYEQAAENLVAQGAAELTGPVATDEGTMKARVFKGVQIAWARYLAAPDAKSAFHATYAFGIFFDKWRLMRGEPTVITEERRYERFELLAKIQHVLETRGATLPKVPALPAPPEGSNAVITDSATPARCI